MSTGVGMSSCCLSGKVHEGKPQGTYEDINGLETYVSYPEGSSKEKSIIFICDIFGYKLNNIQLLADQYAKAGFFCYVPDFHQGNSIDEGFLKVVEPPLKEREQAGLLEKAGQTATVATTLPPWLITHREAVSKPLIEGFIRTIKMTPGTNKVGTIGFCWGGRYAILSAHELVDCAYACHPSLVSIPGDFDPVTKPLSIAVGDKDSLLGQDKNLQIKEILDAKSVPTEVVIYEDQIHGFALRSDWSSDKDKKAMDDAEKQGIAWFEKYLAA